MKKSCKKIPKIEVIDLFCGIGGLSFGMKSKGFDILAGYDLDSTCQYAYETNNEAKFIYKDIKTVSADEIRSQYSKNSIRVLAGCAPCQPFSSYAFKNKKKDPNKYDLLYEFGRLVEDVEPDIVTMENVAQILSFKEKPVLQDFVELLRRKDYKVWVNPVYCPDYGVPQTRRRLVLLASKFGNIELIPPTHTIDNYVKVKDVIGNLPELKAGETDKNDPLHRAKVLSPLNMQRIRSTPYGGSWRNWPEELILKCHKSEKGRSFGSVYGRMVWERPAPTMTTQCTGLGNGRFGHPEQDRAISVREAALIQTFPKTYKFFANEKDVAITKASRYIGNAVPPKLGEVIAESIIKHIESITTI
ncbi:MAG: DNA cytosine methyltransferase [Paludibacter sp.]|nr:DNA cytosine methyltransferase [Bacteroidales bacterium]MCM1069283.1 DNA cytosine methyltransferase [Prevotella sp.]MCM1353734.1 DNA cytosine methyltransferase [Bacteroides sp.]MCM1442198.1 DNA cytosine methyltransferase [Muribaculum sp.]MCM1482160.1 DNA cytosine methyltransferase [Paludibacter sp.]